MYSSYAGSVAASSRCERAPGLRMGSFANRFPKQGTSCAAAAAARGVPLASELKTLVVECAGELAAVSVPADHTVRFDAVAACLSVDAVRLAKRRALRRLGLEPGAICAVQEPVWSMLQLISRELLVLDRVTTNDGSRARYYRFAPRTLLSAPRAILGCFARPPLGA